MRCNQNTSFVMIHDAGLAMLCLLNVSFVMPENEKCKSCNALLANCKFCNALLGKCKSCNAANCANQLLQGPQWPAGHLLIPSLGHTLFKLFKGTSRWAQRWQVINNHFSGVDIFNSRLSCSCHNKDPFNSAYMMFFCNSNNLHIIRYNGLECSNINFVDNRGPAEMMVIPWCQVNIHHCQSLHPSSSNHSSSSLPSLSSSLSTSS